MRKRSTIDQAGRNRRKGRRRWIGLLWAAPILAFAAAQLGCTIAINWAVVGISRTVEPNGGSGTGTGEVLLPSGFWSETLLVPPVGPYGIEDMRARRWTTAEVEDGLSFLEGIAYGGNRGCSVWLALRNDGDHAVDLPLHEARLSGGRRIDEVGPSAIVAVQDGIGKGRVPEGSAADPDAYRETVSTYVRFASGSQSRIEEWSVVKGSQSDWGLVQVDPGAECYVLMPFDVGGVYPQRLTLALPARETGGEGRAYAYTLELRRGNRGRERNPKFMALIGRLKGPQQSEEAEEAE